jgi:hypothetical protein
MQPWKNRAKESGIPSEKKAAFTVPPCCSGATVDDEQRKQHCGAVVPLAKEMQPL